MSGNAPVRDTVLIADPKIKDLLHKLHCENESQAHSWKRVWYHITYLLFCLWNWRLRDKWDAYNDLYCTNELLSHSRETCELIYLLTILNGATNIVECGTSFGVTTIYMALAVNANLRRRREKIPGVLTIEKDPNKVSKAKDIWEEAGDEVKSCIDVRQGDLLEVLQEEDLLPPVVDMVFLDAWTSLAMPALMLVMPRLRNGSIVVADRTKTGETLYHEFLTFVRNPANGFLSVTIPFPEGFEVMVYQPGHVMKRYAALGEKI